MLHDLLIFHLYLHYVIRKSLPDIVLTLSMSVRAVEMGCKILCFKGFFLQKKTLKPLEVQIFGIFLKKKNLKKSRF